MVRGYESSSRSVEDLASPPAAQHELILRISEGAMATDLDDLSKFMREADDQLEGRRLFLYRRLGRLSSDQLDQVQALIDHLSPIVAGDNVEASNG